MDKPLFIERGTGACVTLRQALAADTRAILNFVLEDDDVRRERASYVARMRDKMKLPFRRIGRQLNVSKQRAHQLYRTHQALNQ